MGLEVELAFWDERLTTEEAKQMLNGSGQGRRGRREDVDAVAAAVILQSYLDRESIHGT